MEQKIKEYIIGLFSRKNTHQSACMFPEQECSCKKLYDISYDTSLIRGGYMDSFTMIEVLVFIEAMFDVDIPDKEATADNFDTIHNMVGLIKKFNAV